MQPWTCVLACALRRSPPHPATDDGLGRPAARHLWLACPLRRVVRCGCTCHGLSGCDPRVNLFCILQSVVAAHLATSSG